MEVARADRRFYGVDTRTNEELTEVDGRAGCAGSRSARIVTELLLLGSMVVLARLIPPSAFGMFAVAVIVQELAINVPSEGVGERARAAPDASSARHLQAGLALELGDRRASARVPRSLVLALVVDPLFGAETAALLVH